MLFRSSAGPGARGHRPRAARAAAPTARGPPTAGSRPPDRCSRPARTTPARSSPPGRSAAGATTASASSGAPPGTIRWRPTASTSASGRRATACSPASTTPARSSRTARSSAGATTASASSGSATRSPAATGRARWATRCRSWTWARGGARWRSRSGSTATCALFDDGAVKCWGDPYQGATGHGDIQIRGDRPGRWATTCRPSTSAAATASRSRSRRSRRSTTIRSARSWPTRAPTTAGSSAGAATTTASSASARRRQPRRRAGTRSETASSGSTSAPPPRARNGRRSRWAAAISRPACWATTARSAAGATNGSGQLGNGDDREPALVRARARSATRTWCRSPRPLSPSPRAGQDEGDGAHACALLATGAVTCWGENSFGQLGTGDTTPLSRPSPPLAFARRLHADEARARQPAHLRDRGRRADQVLGQQPARPARSRRRPAIATRPAPDLAAAGPRPCRRSRPAMITRARPRGGRSQVLGTQHRWPARPRRSHEPRRRSRPAGRQPRRGRAWRSRDRRGGRRGAHLRGHGRRRGPVLGRGRARASSGRERCGRAGPPVAGGRAPGRGDVGRGRRRALLRAARERPGGLLGRRRARPARHRRGGEPRGARGRDRVRREGDRARGGRAARLRAARERRHRVLGRERPGSARPGRHDGQDAADGRRDGRRARARGRGGGRHDLRAPRRRRGQVLGRQRRRPARPRRRRRARTTPPAAAVALGLGAQTRGALAVGGGVRVRVARHGAGEVLGRQPAPCSSARRSAAPAYGDGPNETGDFLPEAAQGGGRSLRGIAAGRAHACAILDTGDVRCWGDNGYGQLGAGDGDAHSALLRPDRRGRSGTVAVIGARAGATSILAGLALASALAGCGGGGAAQPDGGDVGLDDRDRRRHRRRRRRHGDRRRHAVGT